MTDLTGPLRKSAIERFADDCAHDLELVEQLARTRARLSAPATDADIVERLLAAAHRRMDAAGYRPAAIHDRPIL